MSDHFSFKWSRDPKPSQLERLAPDVRKAGLQALKRETRDIIRTMVHRVQRQHRIASARTGRSRPIPEYSEAYQAELRERGESTTPDLTRRGVLLSHLRGRVRPRDAESLELIVAPYGRASKPGTTGTRVRTRNRRKAGFWIRDAYSYYDRRRGRTVHVPESRIPIPRNAKDSDAKKRRKRRVIYNAHLATQLALRQGTGKWRSRPTRGRYASGPGSFLTLTEREQQELWRVLQRHYTLAAGRRMERVSGR